MSGTREQANWTLLCNEALHAHARAHDTGRQRIRADLGRVYRSYLLTCDWEMHGRGVVMIHYGEVTGADGWCCQCKVYGFGRRERAIPSQNGRSRAPTWPRWRGVTALRLTNGETFVSRHWGCNDICGLIK